MLLAILILFAIFSIGLLVVVFTELIVFVMTRVPFVPSPRQDIAEIVERVPISQEDYVFDLGSGNGKVVFAIEQLSGARVKGFQLPGWTQWYARLKKTVTGSSAELVSDNFFKHPWTEATVVYAYLYPFLMRDVGAKALADCRPGTKVIARDFPIPNMPLAQKWQTPTGHEMHVYIV